MDNREANLPEHDPKYDIEESVLEAANKKMVSISELKGKGVAVVSGDGSSGLAISKKAPDTIKVGNRIIHKRTPEQYQDIWESFLMNCVNVPESDPYNFEKYMGYGVDDIKRIGIEKFIDAFDWINAAQVNSFRTDIIHIVPCVECDANFAEVEHSFGLCETCQQLYDLDFLEKVIDETAQEVKQQFLEGHPDAKAVPATRTEGVALFLLSAEFRHMFLKTVLDQRDKERMEKNEK